MSKKGKNGLNDRETLAYAELSYMDYDNICPTPYPLKDNENKSSTGKSIHQFFPIEKQQEDKYQTYSDVYSNKEVLAAWNDPSGFSAIAVRDNSGKIVISYRGTDMTRAEDWLDNVRTMTTAESRQSELAQEFFDHIKSMMNDGDTINLVGHSKGGELALKVAFDNMEEISSVNTLSAQPPNIEAMGLTEEQLAKIIEENRDKFNIARMEGDIVPFLGENYFEEITRVIKTNTYDPNKDNGIMDAFESHSLKNIYLDGDEFEDSYRENESSKELQNDIEKLGNLIQNNEIAKQVILDVIEYLEQHKDQINQKIADIVDKINKIKEIKKEVSEKIKIILNKIAEAFKAIVDIFKKDGIPVEPEIVVDTQKLKDLADRLQKVSSRLSTLDWDLNSLYLTEPLTAIKPLLQANLLLPNKSKIKKCVEYLDETAEAFEMAEKNIKALV